MHHTAIFIVCKHHILQKNWNMYISFIKFLPFQWTVLFCFNNQTSQLIADANPFIGASISGYHHKRVVIRKIFVFCLPSHKSLTVTSLYSPSTYKSFQGNGKSYVTCVMFTSECLLNFYALFARSSFAHKDGVSNPETGNQRCVNMTDKKYRLLVIAMIHHCL